MSTLWALIKSLPVLLDLIDQFVAWYAVHEIENMKKENRDSVKKAVTDHDQRAIEKAIGSPLAGAPSNISGVVLRDHLPGV